MRRGGSCERLVNVRQRQRVGLTGERESQQRNVAQPRRGLRLRLDGGAARLAGAALQLRRRDLLDIKGLDFIELRLANAHRRDVVHTHAHRAIRQNDDEDRALRAARARAAGDMDAAAGHERAAAEIAAVMDRNIAAHQAAGREIDNLWPDAAFKDFNDQLMAKRMDG